MSSTGPSIDSLIEQSQLPALPQSAVRLLKISQDPDCGPIEFAAPIEADIGLTSQILRFVNSSYFGFRREIGSIRHAITLVGVRTIKNFALWNAVFSLIPDPKCGPFRLKSLWQDSLRRGLFARSIATRMKLDTSDDIFAATILQDMSLPLLAKQLPSEYEELFGAREGGRKRLSDLELERFGWSHATVGAKLVGVWGLPDQFADMIVHHVDPMDGSDIQQSPERSVTALSAILPSTQDQQWFESSTMHAAYDLLSDGNLPSLRESFAEIDSEFQEFAPMLNLPAASKSLVDSLELATQAIS